MPNRAPLAEEPTICTKCDLSFTTFMAYHRHKMQSRRHITCEVCSADFESHEACKQHHDSMHSHEQSMDCPGCGKNFTRMGGLMNHIEIAGCRGFPNEQVDKARKEKFDWYSNFRNAKNFQDYGRTAGEFANKSPMPFKPKAYTDDVGGDVAYAQNQGLAAPPQPKFEDDNLLAFEDPSEALNSPWGETITPKATKSALPATAAPPVLTQSNFPVLSAKPRNVMDAPVVELKAANACATNQKLFADPPPAVAPPTHLLEPLNIQEEDEDPMDPDSRIFEAMKYYIVYSRKYKCPHRGCAKSSPTEAAFIQHLKSPAHRNEKLQCINCLRYFGTATALTQHCESQGIRCKVRETSGYDGVVDGITGGTAVTAGRHKDDTVKYVVNPALLPTPNMGVAGVMEAHKTAATEKNERFNNYWETQKPKW